MTVSVATVRLAGWPLSYEGRVEVFYGENAHVQLIKVACVFTKSCFLNRLVT